ncbi:MAG: hypothetical protein H7061_00965 [Bdellovibrionaceae bacterium]|nr:hypothetical protein [Bdellovibrio sp.]
MSKLLVLIFLVLQFHSVSHATEFELKPLATNPSTPDEVEEGLKLLYKNNVTPEVLAELKQQSLQFQSKVYNTIQRQIELNKNISVSTTEKFLAGNFVKETVVRFASLIRRNEPHASDDVVAKIYEPATQRRFCEYQYPTSIILHHILNEVGVVEDIAKVMASGVLGQPAIVVVLHMPHYGLRRQGTEEFLTTDTNQFKQNILQLILDVHALKNYLDTRKNIDAKKISLAGVSLGSVLGFTVGAFDQSFSGFGSLMGGADMAQILINRATTNPKSEVGVILQKVNPTEENLRKALAPVDGLTWAHRFKNKKFMFLIAGQDEVIDYANSVKPLLELFKQNQNSIIQSINGDGHVPSGSALKKIKELFLPLLRFTIDEAPPIDRVCETNN